MKKGFMQLALLAIMLLTAGASSSWGQTYKLVKVTSQDEIVSGGLYVFEQKGYVMIDIISSNSLQTTSSYQTEIDGTQNYIWTIEGDNNSFKLKNINKSVNACYLSYGGSSTNVCWNEKNKATSWSFTPNNNDTFIIEDLKSSKRYLGYTNPNSTVYKAYTHSSDPSLDENTPYFITVYKLTEAVTVTTAGLATYVSTSALDYSNVEGLKAYKAKVSGNDVALTRVGQVPAGEGVLLRATNTLTENTTFDIPVASTVTSWSDNDFIPGTGESVATQNGSNYNYILNKVNGVVGFYKAAGNTVATNRAYLSTTATPGARGMVMTFDDDATSIVCLEDEALNHSQETVVYDLQGRRVNGDVKKGLYIVNGKKVIK